MRPIPANSGPPATPFAEVYTSPCLAANVPSGFLIAPVLMKALYAQLPRIFGSRFRRLRLHGRAASNA